MSRCLLDTNVLIDFSKGIPNVSLQLPKWIDGTDIVAICAVTVAEFYGGLTPSDVAEGEEFLTSLTNWDISRDTAMRAGQDRYMLARTGATITTTDSLLAAVAREYNATPVTSNLSDFPMRNLTLLSVR